MQLEMTLSLPRDARYVPVLRSVAAHMLQGAAAPAAAVSDIELALSEACANVVRHAVDSEEFSVTVVVFPWGCTIEVVDCGPGFNQDQWLADRPAVRDAEAGRGLYLMRNLVDELQFSRTDSTMKVQFAKHWDSLDGAEPVVR